MNRFFCLFLFCSFFLIPRCFSQVNLQSGAAEFSIPLYGYTDAGNRLGLNASLIYTDGNGLKVSELASAVGTGWALDCGGVISRIQHGEPDDQEMDNPPAFTTSDFANYETNFYPNGYLYNTTTYLPTDVIDNGATYSPYVQALPNSQKVFKQGPQYLADREQDIFAFTFNGRKGEFVIGKNGQAVTLVDSKLQISFQQQDMTGSNIRTRISQFTITDETGIQYIFKDLELGYVCDYTDLRQALYDNANIDELLSLPLGIISGSNSNGSHVNVVLGVTTGWFIVNKWYLSQIVNPFTGKQITFNYTTYEEDVNTDKEMNSVAVSGNMSDVSVFWSRYKIRGKRLAGVALSNSEQLTFVYSSSPRIDLPYENALSQLRVSYNNNTIYTWNFTYGYMVGIDNAIQTPTYNYSYAEKQWSRLCLLSLQKTGTNNIISEPPYQFAYNMGGDNNANMDVIPPKYSIFQDHYGYYNAGIFSTNNSEGFEQSFYTIANLNALVRNLYGSFKNVYSTVAKNGILKSVTFPMGGMLTYTYEGNMTQNGAVGGVRVNSSTQYDGVSHTNDVIKQYKYLNSDEQTSSGWGGETFSYSMNGTSTAFGCLQEETPAALLKEVAMNFFQNGILYHTFSIESAEVLGSQMADAVTDAIGGFAISLVVGYFLQNTQSPPTTTTSYTIYQTNSFTANNPLPYGYGRTEAISVNGSGTIGKVVYEFSNPNATGDPAIAFPTLTVPYSNKPRCAPWVYGLPKTITIYDMNGNQVKQTVNHYNYIINTLNSSNFASTSWTTLGSEYGCPYIIPTDNNTSLISQEPQPYYPFTGHNVLNSTDEIVFNSAQQSNIATTNFDYDNNFQLHHKYTNNSKGEMIETFYYHPYDYSLAAGGIGAMNAASANILAPVISTESYINKSDGNQYMTGASATNYQVSVNGDIKPSVTYSFQNPLPVASSVLQPFNTSSVIRDPNYYQQVAMYGYDLNGNVVQTATGGNRILSSIFDYNGQLQVASVLNASYNDIGYTSFEAQGAKPGSWINTAAIVSSDSRTGSQSFNLSDPSNNNSNGYFGFGALNSTLTYVISFWSKNGTPCIIGARGGNTIITTCQSGSGWKQGNTVNGWTYYEVQVGNIDQVGVTGSGLIDEFRVYPQGSLMTTTTYAPLIGKTSECDPANKVTYFQYDELGRLRFVLDDQMNIIKMYDYNYQQ
jgi:hypothetical protein